MSNILREHKTAQKVRCIIESERFAILFAWFAVLVLLGTTVYWAILGARVQQNNADQLVSSFLFKDLTTWRNAVFPSQHTFLLKWPLFYLIKLLGFADWSFITVTVLMVLATVIALAFLLWRLVRRPLLFGVMCLALASVLLLIPTQPYPGGLLPVNMAMLTTRNIEYILYIVSLYLFVSARRVRSWQFFVGTLLATLLIASDSLFLSLGVGAALLSLATYAFAKRWAMVTESITWLTGELIAGLLTALILAAINASHVTHIVTSSHLGPYSLVTNFHDLALALIYAVSGILTNIGANPVFDAMTLTSVLHTFRLHALGWGGIGYTINALILLGGVYCGFVLLKKSVQKESSGQEAVWTKVGLALIWSSVAAILAFVVTMHYYPVDARYLSIVLFAVFIVSAIVLRQKQLPVWHVVIWAALLIVAIGCSLPAMVRLNADDSRVVATVNKRDEAILDVLEEHPTLLVGDYWRVMPIKETAPRVIKVLPLSGCSQPASILSSSSWQPDLRTHAFAYLLSLDINLTNFPNCTISQVTGSYGRPNNTILIAGTVSAPKELLLIYDHGENNSEPLVESNTNTNSTISPTSLDSTPNTSCPVPTTMAFVAHEDDDLLFMNPDIYHAIKSGYCMRTVFLTAGDAGANRYYWLSREQASEAAYSLMAGAASVWENRTVQLADGEFATFANPQGNANVTLIFLHLPDGNLSGEGFKASSYESLAKLYASRISLIHTVDKQSTYNKVQLIAALTNLMIAYSPTEIFTQSTYPGTTYHDHSDHNAVGRLVKLAYDAYEQQQFANRVTIPIKFYLGYPVHTLPPNINAIDQPMVNAAYFAYAQYDPAVCTTILQCKNKSTFGLYLTRQYQYPY